MPAGPPSSGRRWRAVHTRRVDRDPRQLNDRPSDRVEVGVENLPAGSRRSSVLRRLVDVVSALVVLGVLLLPNRFYAMTPGAFLRIPAEVLAGVAVVLALPRRAARVAVGIGAAVAG